MAQAIARPVDGSDRDLSAALPLYFASLVVTLAGVGAVGVTITSTTWTPIWATLAVVGHLVSLGLRRARVAAESVFYPVMLIGSLLVLQQVVAGGVFAGFDSGMGNQPLDMATASVVGSLAVARTFTLVTNSSLLFSPVPTITMLALVASNNLNAEVPVFFGLFLLASLFTLGYEAHLRRVARTGRAATPVMFHLLTSWVITLAVAGVALLAPVLIQPVLGHFSPFNMPGLNRMRQTPTFNQPSANAANVGQGPIRLSPLPLFEVYTSEPGGRLRTGVFSHYNGRQWTIRDTSGVKMASVERVNLEGPPYLPGLSDRYEHHRYVFAPDSLVGAGVPQRDIAQRVAVLAYVPGGIPAFGHITELKVRDNEVDLMRDGGVRAGRGTGRGDVYDLVSRVAEPPADLLRSARHLRRDQVHDERTLEVPQNARRVAELAQTVTAAATNDYDRVQAILNYIETHCEYTLDEVPTPTGEDAADFYLFTSRRGACDLAATAATLMCRAVGIPARVAIGYVAEEPLAQGGGFMVRHEHAHMWSEAYFEGFGWVPFDAAPPAATIRDHPLKLAWYRITGLFSKIGGGGLDAVLLVIVLAGTALLTLSWLLGRLRRGAGALLRRRRVAAGSAGGPALLAYERSLAALRRRGWGREPWMTPREYLAHLEAAWVGHPEALTPLRRLTAAFEAARYGAEDPPDADPQADARALARLIPRRPRPEPTPVPAPEAA